MYEPAEDTFLLLDALMADAPWLQSAFAGGPAPLCLEVGVGSGAVTVCAAKVLRKVAGAALCIATDVNESAADVARHMFRHNKVARWRGRVCAHSPAHSRSLPGARAQVAADVVLTDLVAGLNVDGKVVRTTALARLRTVSLSPASAGRADLQPALRTDGRG